MRTPSATDLLLTWERGLDQSPTRQALLLLSACSPETDGEKLAALPIGIRDEYLLRLRQRLFGNSVTAISQCINCGEKLDVEFGIHDICGTTREYEISSPEKTYQLQVEGYAITFRLPNSTDFLVVMEDSINGTPEEILLKRCVLDVHKTAVAVSGNAMISTLPDFVCEAISDEMANADPHAQIKLSLSCPTCNHTWNALFNIVDFLWNEIHAWARRMLRNIDILARTYGWREADILAMSARRREIYLELARS